MIEDSIDQRLILEELQKDEERIHKDEKKIKIAFLGIGLLLLVVVGIFYFLFNRISDQKSVNITNEMSPTSSVVSAPKTMVTAVPTPTPIIVIKEVVKEVSVKEQFIPFGSGSNQTDVWGDVPGLQANIDFGSYQNIKDVRFEVTVHIPTANGTASVRLFNMTDKHPVWNSEVTVASDIYTVSPSIIYDKGLKTYQVQMKTQLKTLANLSLARIHITLN